MLPELPTLNAQQRYLCTGKLLNLFRDRILRMTPIAGRGVDLKEEEFGIRVHLTGASTATSALDFAGSLAGSSVTVRAGKVLHTDWTGFDGNDPQCAEWAAEALTVSGSTLTVPDGDSVWLKLTIAATTVNSEGPLSATGSGSVSVTGGGGGAGGSGGGGAGGAGESPASDADDGAAGLAGGSVTPGIGGLSGAVGAGGVGGTTTPKGDGSPGGGGGIGEDGEQGKAVPLYAYVNGRIKMRRWRVTAGSFVVATNKPTSSDTLAYIRICTRSGSSLIQHQIGCVTMMMPVVSFVQST